MNPNLIYLVQTDTIAGFLSQDKKRLAHAKKRSLKKPFLINTDSFEEQKDFVRSPKNFRAKIRRAKKSTFIYPNGYAIRVVFEDDFKNFMKKFGWLYSTSANRSEEKFDINFALQNADIIVEGKKGYKKSNPSSIFKLSKSRMKKIR